MARKWIRVCAWTLAQVAAIGFSMEVFAGSAALTLGTTGTITAAPVWEDGAGTVITNISFDFTGIAQSSANLNVDSTSKTVKLVNASAYPATVTLVRPASCTIGSNAVANTDVNFLNNGSAVGTDGNISIASAANQTYALRFAAAGNYGTFTGAVSCTSTGSLTYSY